MFKSMYKTKKTMWKIIFTIVVVLCLYLIFEIGSIKQTFENPSQTSFYDISGVKNISPEQRTVDSGQLPDLLSSYIKNEKLYHELPSLLYEGNPIRENLSRLVVNTMYDEEELIEIYVNQLYLGTGILGLGTGANYFFNKSLADTTIIEQIFLLSKGRSTERRNIEEDLTDLMEYLRLYDYLSDTNYNVTIKQVEAFLQSLYKPHTFAQSYIQQVIAETEKELDLSEGEVIRSGFTISTNINTVVQKQLFTHFLDDRNFPRNQANQPESGMVIVEQKTGNVIAAMGGRKFQHNPLNRVSEIKRQPASTFKPLLVFGPALEKGWEAQDQLKDEPLVIGQFQPRNYDYTYRKQVSLSESLIFSYNVPTVWLLHEIGLETGLDYLNKFGLFEVDPAEGYQLALGFTRNGVNPLALAQAYTVFSNKGNMLSTHTINEIKSKTGKSLYMAKVQVKPIFTESTAKKMNSLLIETVKRGTGEKASIANEAIAGKTGTTSYDGWFVGYNDKYVAAVWMGPDQIDPKQKLSVDGGEYPAILFNKVMSAVLEETKK